MSTNRIDDAISALDTIFSSPGLLGFSPLAIDLRRALNYNAVYPPRNIIDTGDGSWVVEVAIAGFSPNEISVEVSNSYLVISGSSNSDEAAAPEEMYVHHGLARRDFQFSIRLGEHVKVSDEHLPFIQNGLLLVNLKREVPDPKETQVYEVVSVDHIGRNIEEPESPEVKD